MQTKTLTKKQNQRNREEQDNYVVRWSDTFEKNEDDLSTEPFADSSISKSPEDLEEHQQHGELYNRTYVKLRFRQLLFRLESIKSKEDSLFLQGISFAEQINKEFYIYEDYPIERQVLSLSKLAVSNIIQEDKQGGLEKLLKILSDLVGKDLDKKGFTVFRKTLVQQKLVEFTS